LSDEGKNAFRLSILSGILLIISGTHGSVGVYGVILAVLMLLVKNVFLLSILRVVAFILILLAYTRRRVGDLRRLPDPEIPDWTGQVCDRYWKWHEYARSHPDCPHCICHAESSTGRR